MEQLQLGFSVLTFVLLIALMFSVKKISAGNKAQQSARKVQSAPEAFTSFPQAGISPEVVAAITAAVAAVWEGQNGFVVRHVKRINNAPAWNRAGREEQIYSRF